MKWCARISVAAFFGRRSSDTAHAGRVRTLGAMPCTASSLSVVFGLAPSDLAASMHRGPAAYRIATPSRATSRRSLCPAGHRRSTPFTSIIVDFRKLVGAAGRRPVAVAGCHLPGLAGDSA